MLPGLIQSAGDLEASLVRGCEGVVAGGHEDSEAPVDGVTCQVALHHRSLDVPPVCHRLPDQVAFVLPA